MGGREGDVPCISVKYLIYLNINKVELFVKFSVLCSCSGPWVESEVAEPGVEGSPLLEGSVDLSSVVRGHPLVFLPAKVKLHCLQIAWLLLALEHHDDQCVFPDLLLSSLPLVRSGLPVGVLPVPWPLSNQTPSSGSFQNLPHT